MKYMVIVVNRQFLIRLLALCVIDYCVKRWVDYSYLQGAQAEVDYINGLQHNRDKSS